MIEPQSEFVSYVHRDSDERQFSSNQANLPILGLFKTKPATYPEYHTSLDDLSFITTDQLERSFIVVSRLLECLEAESETVHPMSNFVGEPFLSKRALYPTESTISRSQFPSKMRNVIDFLAFANGMFSIADIAEECNMSISEALRAYRLLVEMNVVQNINKEFVKQKLG